MMEVSGDNKAVTLHCEVKNETETDPTTCKNNPVNPLEIKISSKGVENAKKRLRAFSIQKKTPITPIVLPKPAASGSPTVVIGKLTGVKTTPKPDESEIKKTPKPPKPGSGKKSLQDSYSDLQKRTLAEIEDMKRKMELVDLGIPLGLICPTPTSETAMPTKAMPPIKSFLDPEKLDEIIREAKKAKAEGRKFKFDYQKVLPDYDNPFQNKKKDESISDKVHHDRRKSESERDKDRKADKYESKRYSEYRKDDKYRHRYKETNKNKEDSQKKYLGKTTEKESNLNLNDYLICHSWSLDNDDKNNSSGPKPLQKHSKYTVEPSEVMKANIAKQKEVLLVDSPKTKPVKVEKLQPVIDSFEYEIDAKDDEILDIFDEDIHIEKFARKKIPKQSRDEHSYIKSVNQDGYRDTISDSLNDDTFLESIINEIKQEDMSEGDCSEKGLVEYDISPAKDDSPRIVKRSSATPDIDERAGQQSQRSDYSGYNSIDSYRTADTSESGYRSIESYRLSMEKELDVNLDENLPRSTVDSLETWSFVLKVCQPLLFRHDKNKCYRETRTEPKLWYTENPKICNCVKDRVNVYQELEMGKMNLVDRVYGCDQILDSPLVTSRSWYLKSALCQTENAVPLSIEWEAEDSQQDGKTEGTRERKPRTPQKDDDISLDREYQRFMEAVWPEVTDPKVDSSRSTTPVRHELKKKRKEDQMERDDIEEKKAKKIKLNSEDWSQESDIEDEIAKSKKLKEKMKSKLRKRKQESSSSTDSSSSSSSSDSDAAKRKNKAMKKKALKKAKSKMAKRRRMGRKILKKLKEKQKKRKKAKDSDDDDVEDKRKNKKSKKKKQLKLNKKNYKKKKSRAKSSSSSDSSSSSSDSDSDIKKKSKKAKRKSQESKIKKAKKRKQSSSDSTQSEELFDVNILNNIKTERLTDDEESKKMMDFSPRRQSNHHPREIINVKELQNDFVGNNIDIKKEIIEEIIHDEPVKNEVVELIDDKRPLEEDKKGDLFENKMTTKLNNEVLEVKVTAEDSKDGLIEFKESPKNVLISDIKVLPEESNVSQSSSQDSTCSIRETHTYEKDDTYLRPSSQNSNYSFHDVINANQGGHYQKHIDAIPEDDKYTDEYEAGNYEMYEQLAMAYQSDVASKRTSPPRGMAQRIETVVHARSCGEIKCDWRPGVAPVPPARPHRPSRWGLKPGEVNIVLTGGHEVEEPPSPRVYPIQSLANRTELNTGYDEAYLDMYGAADRLQYGDCFSEVVKANGLASGCGGAGSANITVNISPNKVVHRTSSLDARIDQVLKETVLGDVAKEAEEDEGEVEAPEKGILLSSTEGGRAAKRVSFADGYTPGQDSDLEEPPVKKRKKMRRLGCAWPCPASHPDHVPLWDALPPPPPPPGSPPPRRCAAPPPLLQSGTQMRGGRSHQLHQHQFDASGLSGFAPPEPTRTLVAQH